MRFRLWAALGLVVVAPVFAAAPKAHLEVVTTEHADAPGGALRFEGSWGELNIEAWDGDGVQMVVTRSAWVTDLPAEKDRVNQELNAIHITAEKRGDDLVIRTPRPRRGSLAHLDYRVMVPKGLRLAVQHLSGDVVVMRVTGAIEASVKRGDILLSLPGDVAWSFDAECREGRIHSNFAGIWHRRHWIAERYSAPAQAGPVPVHLHVGVGGIDIRKLAL
jgi:hypothetical protein